MGKSNESRVAIVLYGKQGEEFERIKRAVEQRSGVEVTARALVMAALRALEASWATMKAKP